ncbi:GntR family transcriptional regulator [Salinarimonas soli]|uniref:GntR family transcriptional regulator n=1 Tax=Salinarimonas soli TaxID=1638099 RepID=A0A5B2V9V5_9HYPH|nr:GntR family transcriptional regulator [Salinarimonas soli]KAA2235220.1 GntR family transcriptional regulator [Salinarimonas soli]
MPPRNTRSHRIAPLYHRIYVELRRGLTEGGLDPRERLPSEPALAARYQVSRVTVRRTLEQLEADGLIRRVRGVGTFPVRVSATAEKTNISGVLENLITYDQSTTARNLAWDRVEPGPEIAPLFGPGLALRILRVRSHKGEPMSLTTILVPAIHADLLDPNADASEPVIRALDRKGILAARAEQAITAVPASEMAVATLGVAADSPLICMRRLMTDEAGGPVLHQESLYAPDRFEYRMSLTRLSLGPAARWTPIG